MNQPSAPTAAFQTNQAFTTVRPSFVSTTPITKRPRNGYFSLPVQTRCDPSSVTPERRVRYRNNIVALMTSPITTQPNDERHSESNSIIPEGAFKIVLKVRMRAGMKISDQKAILCEYGRKKNGEEGVIRCDIVFEVNSRGLAKGTFYEIWLIFEDASAYVQHEKTSHAAKLRVWLENPGGGDSAVVLTKLSYSSRILEPLQPSALVWKSNINYAVEEQEVRDRRVADAAVSLLHNEQSLAGKESSTFRKSLEVLLANVGLENVTVLVAVATATSPKRMPSLIGLCEQYVEELDRSIIVVRTGVFVEKNSPLTIVVMSVHDSVSNEGAFFDMELAMDMVDDEGWSVHRYFSLSPDKVGWEPQKSKVDLALDSQPHSFLGPIEKLGDPKSSIPVAAPTSTSCCRLVFGCGSFDRLKNIIREMSQISAGTIRAMVICGFNAARAGPMLAQIQFEKDKNTGHILRKQGINVLTCMPNIKRLRQGMSFVREYDPDVIIGYGGGSVLEMTKIIGRLGHASEDEVEDCISRINDAASKDAGRVTIMPKSKAIPVLLLPCTVTAGGELADICIIEGEAGKRRSRRLAIDFEDPPNLIRNANERVIVVDSRIISPRRLDGFHASQGALMLVCRCIETMISMYELPDHELFSQLEVYLLDSVKTVLPALRESTHATGHSRDPLTAAKTQVGFAADCAGRLGVCSRITLAIVDELLDGAQPSCFQMIIIRVTIALLEELSSWKTVDAERLMLAVVVGTETEEAGKLLRALRERAEDTAVLLLPQMGLVLRKIPAIASHVRKTILEESVSTSFERQIADDGVLERVLHSAMKQGYEL